MKLFRLFSIFVVLAMVFNLSLGSAFAQAPQAEKPQAELKKSNLTYWRNLQPKALLTTSCASQPRLISLQHIP